jgi:hypothetical protein
MAIIAINNRANPVSADPTHILSNTSMMLPLPKRLWGNFEICDSGV